MEIGIVTEQQYKMRALVRPEDWRVPFLPDHWCHRSVTLCLALQADL